MKKKCFVIMPITTSDQVVEGYQGDGDHFGHVLECLFGPAVAMAGCELVSPAVTGADLIHAEIIRRLDSVDLVLCDMSSLNSNVFFELGVRTAVNKPVCMVCDELTKDSVPFDTGIVNYHEYDSSLAPWHLDDQIKKLADHISLSLSRSNGQNPLWEFFGISKHAELSPAEDVVNVKLDYIMKQLEAVVAGRMSSSDSMHEQDDESFKNIVHNKVQAVLEMYSRRGEVLAKGESLIIRVHGSRDPVLEAALTRAGESTGLAVRVSWTS